VAGVRSSDAAIVAVLIPPGLPEITAQPEAMTVSAGVAVSFSVGVSGTGPFSYQWYKNGSALGGATSATCSIVAATMTDVGTYMVTVGNANGSTSSQAASLTVTVAAGTTERGLFVP